MQPADAQEQTVTSAGAPVVSPGTLAAIRGALEHPPAIDLWSDGLRFRMQVLARQKTFADYLTGRDITFGRVERFNAKQALGAGGRGGGFDVLPFILSAVEQAREARRAYQTRKIREQIDRELRGLEERRLAATSEGPEPSSGPR